MVTKNYTDEEFESLMSEYDYKFQKGDLVKGLVCGYDSEGVIVDIGAKTSALCPEREARIDLSKSVEQTLQKGEAYEFLIIREDSSCHIKKLQWLMHGKKLKLLKKKMQQWKVQLFL